METGLEQTKYSDGPTATNKSRTMKLDGMLHTALKY